MPPSHCLLHGSVILGPRARDQLDDLRTAADISLADVLDRTAHHERMDLATADRQLQAAQRANDVEALDGLLHPRVVYAGPDGSIFSKDDDLAGYRSGALRVTRLVEASLEVREDGQTGWTQTVALVDAVQEGVALSKRLRYTRLWVRDEGHWRVLAATLVPL